MTTWVTELGSAPEYWLVPVESLPDGDVVIAHIRSEPRTKVVDDAEAGEIAKRLPYDHRGAGVEEIVFCRVGPPTGEVVQLADDAWPGEDRTYVVDEVGGALALAQRFAVEYGASPGVRGRGGPARGMRFSGSGRGRSRRRQPRLAACPPGP